MVFHRCSIVILIKFKLKNNDPLHGRLKEVHVRSFLFADALFKLEQNNLEPSLKLREKRLTLQIISKVSTVAKLKRNEQDKCDRNCGMVDWSFV